MNGRILLVLPALLAIAVFAVFQSEDVLAKGASVSQGNSQYTCGDYLDRLGRDRQLPSPGSYPVRARTFFTGLQRFIFLGQITVHELVLVDQFFGSYDALITTSRERPQKERNQLLRQTDISVLRDVAGRIEPEVLCEGVILLDFEGPKKVTRENVDEMQKFFQATPCEADRIKVAWVDTDIRRLSANFLNVNRGDPEAHRRNQNATRREIDDLRTLQAKLTRTDCKR